MIKMTPSDNRRARLIMEAIILRGHVERILAAGFTRRGARPVTRNNWNATRCHCLASPRSTSARRSDIFADPTRGWPISGGPQV